MISSVATAQSGHQNRSERQMEKAERRIERQMEKTEHRMEKAERRAEHQMEKAERHMGHHKHSQRHGDAILVSGDHMGMYGDGREVVKVISPESARIGETINVEFYINYDRLLIERNEEYVITPYLVHGENSLRMRPVVFVGENCYNKLDRRHEQYGEAVGEMVPYETIVMTRQDLREKRREMRKNPRSVDLITSNAVRYVASFPFQPWMHGAEIVLQRELGGCNNRDMTFAGDFGTLYNPLPPQVVFIEPEVETVKARSDKMTARVIFKVNRTDLDLNLADNAMEMKRVYDFTDNVMNNEDLTVTGISMVGYASPEGRFAHNNDLSKGRVNTISEMIKSRYNIDAKNIRISNVAEDWDSVSRWVAKSDLMHKSEVLDIISTTSDPDARDAKIRALDKSATYNRLLKDLYPQLRRTEYSIQYTVEPFTVEKGREVIKTNPQHLSLYEFYQIAESYPMNSKEYKNAYETAIRFYPNDNVANNNMAAMALREGDVEMARRYLARVEGYDKALNNMGVLAVMDGDMELAEKYFRQAARNGVKEARQNLENLSTFGFE